MIKALPQSDQKENMSANQPVKYTWSYSSIGLFKQCPQKYYRIRVKKDIVEPESDAMRYGTDVHKAAEDYIKEDTPIPAKFSFMQKPLDTLKSKDGRRCVSSRWDLQRT